MNKYIDGKIRFCPNCNLNIRECTCQKQVKFFSVTQQQFDNLISQNNDNENNE